MMRILVGYDGSDHARKALERAAEIAKYRQAEVAVMSVSHVAVSGHGPSIEDPQELGERDSELQEATQYLGKHGIAARVVHGHGDPADALAEEARSSEADLIVVGTHGRGLARVLLGSVSTKVVQHAPCDVLVVR